MAYFENDTAISRLVATYVVRIFNGERPADMPIELPNQFDLVINLKAVTAQGLTIPQSVLNQATRVIE